MYVPVSVPLRLPTWLIIARYGPFFTGSTGSSLRGWMLPDRDPADPKGARRQRAAPFRKAKPSAAQRGVRWLRGRLPQGQAGGRGRMYVLLCFFLFQFFFDLVLGRFLCRCWCTCVCRSVTSFPFSVLRPQCIYLICCLA